MLVTVVIPLYNKKDTIVRAVQSVLSQTYRAFELIVVDDGSTDGSALLLQQALGAHLQLVSQSNAGPGAARNAGARAGAGGLIAFLDADDEWRPDFLTAAVTALQTHPECAAYVCGYDAASFKAERPNKVAELGLQGPDTLPADLDGAAIKRRVDAMHSSCTAIRRSVFETAGGFYAQERCLYGEDSYLWIQVLFSSPLYWDAQEHVVFHVEDSALGYAVQRRMRARPLVYDDAQLLRQVAEPQRRAALARAIRCFAQFDIYVLACSGAWQEAARLRTKFAIGSRRDVVLDRLRFLKHRFTRRAR